jgi:hypothetical protein
VHEHRRREGLGIALLGLLTRVAAVCWAQARFPAVEDGHYYDLLARRIATGEGYTWLWPDGTVTFVAHYPIGYPALVGAAYAIFGASTTVAMALNAVLGAASAYCAFWLVETSEAEARGPSGIDVSGVGRSVVRWRPLAAGIAVALHPALVPYTAALMTEGVTASLLVIAAALAAAARVGTRPGWALAGAGIAMGVSTLVRPQCLVLAPLFGALAVPAWAAARARVRSAALIGTIALACVLPWTARNCARMHRCALVSVNGGWNLLIGATTEAGAWHPVAVPPECATVWDEAGKDVCFERAARNEIVAAPLAWASRAPAKLAATFDYFGAAPWYLHASNPTAFDERAKTALAAVETLVCRLLLLAALVVCGRLEGPRGPARKALALIGAVAAVTLHGWLAYLLLPVLVALRGWRALARGPVLPAMTACVVATTAAIHAVFFGAGRYGLVVVPFVTALAFVSSGAAPAAAAASPPPPLRPPLS